MMKAPLPEPSARPYSPPRLIRPEAEGLSPEGKRFEPTEFIDFFAYGPS